MSETVWIAVAAIVLAALVLWLWSARQPDRVASRPEEKNPIDIES